MSELKKSFTEQQSLWVEEVNKLGAELSALTVATYKADEFVAVLNRLTALYGELVASSAVLIGVSLIDSAREEERVV